MDGGNDFFSPMAGPSPPPPAHPELPQEASSSIRPFLRSDLHEFYQVLAESMRHLAPRTPSMLHLLLDGVLVPHDREVDAPLVWTPQDDGDLYVDDDAYGDDGGGGFDFGAVPASGVAVACLPGTTVREGEARQDAECAVCLESYEVGDALRTMPCAHGFHESCIFGWLRVSRLCPLCRFALPADETEEESDTEDES